jgi:hypothetical protein
MEHLPGLSLIPLVRPSGFVRHGTEWWPGRSAGSSPCVIIVTPSDNMVRTQISLGEAEYREAKAEARRQGISLAEFLRRAVALALAQRRKDAHPWMRYAGAVASGDPDASRTVDQVLYGRRRP